MYKFEKDPSHAYHQSPQSNPLRWKVLYREEDTFYPQTAVFMCKDYLNDVVAKYHDWQVTAYGLNNEKMKLNDDGVWLLLSGIKDRDVFQHNLESCINKEVPDTPLQWEVIGTDILMFVPRFFFTNTYYISLLSYTIRVCNSMTKFKSFEELLNSPDRKADYAMTQGSANIAKRWGFNVPEELSKYWMYYTPTHNSDTLENMGHGSTIHNCGINSWTEGLTAKLASWTAKETT